MKTIKRKYEEIEEEAIARFIVVDAFDSFRRGDELTKKEDIENALENHKSKVNMVIHIN